MKEASALLSKRHLQGSLEKMNLIQFRLREIQAWVSLEACSLSLECFNYFCLWHYG